VSSSGPRPWSFTADWGILNPLFALHPSSRYTELAFDFGKPRPGSSAQAAQQQLASTPGPKLVITHAGDRLAFPQANATMFKAIGSHLHFAFAVDGVNGKPVYEAYRYR
jgi:hypothetical protein